MSNVRAEVSQAVYEPILSREPRTTDCVSGLCNCLRRREATLIHGNIHVNILGPAFDGGLAADSTKPILSNPMISPSRFS